MFEEYTLKVYLFSLIVMLLTQKHIVVKIQDFPVADQVGVQVVHSTPLPIPHF